MTALLHPSRVDRLEGWWQYGFDDLHAAGVVLAPANLEIFRDMHLPRVVAAAWALPDPREWVYYDEIPPQKLEVDGLRPTVPVLAEVDWDAAADCEAAYGPIWRRFPSAPVRLQLPDWATTWQDLTLETGVSFIRAWDLAVVDQFAWEGIDEAFSKTWCSSPYASLRDLYMVLNRVGSFDECWLARNYLGPNDAHRHIPQIYIPDLASAQLQLWRCVDGERILSTLHMKLLDDNHQMLPLVIPTIFNDPVAEAYWQEIAMVSKPAAEQALLVAPPWERDALRTDERKAGRPWG